MDSRPVSLCCKRLEDRQEAIAQDSGLPDFRSEGYQAASTELLRLVALRFALRRDHEIFGEGRLSKHQRTLKHNQISIRQRQTIKVVPIAECHYRYKNKSVKTFYLYGKDRKEIFAPSFPSNVACSLMWGFRIRPICNRYMRRTFAGRQAPLCIKVV